VLFPYYISPSTHPYKSQFQKKDLKSSFMWGSQQELMIMTYLSRGIMSLPLLVAGSRRHNPRSWSIAHCTILSASAHKIQGDCSRCFPYTITVKLFEETSEKISSSKPWQVSVPMTSPGLSSYVFVVHGDEKYLNPTWCRNHDGKIHWSPYLSLWDEDPAGSFSTAPGMLCCGVQWPETLHKAHFPD
jgi:hypothetical protein